jgi:acetyl esterase/lipase
VLCRSGQLAIELALAGELILAKGFIAVVPAIRDPEDLTCRAKGAAGRGVQGWILTGEREHDHFRSRAESFCTQAQAVGLGCELEVVPGRGHDFPANFPARLSRMLRALV